MAEKWAIDLNQRFNEALAEGARESARIDAASLRDSRPLRDDELMTDAEMAENDARVTLWNQAPDRNADPDAWEAWTDAHAKELGL